MNAKDFKRLYLLAKSESTLLLWGLLFLAISSAMSLLYPKGIQWMIDYAIIPKDSGRLNEIVFILLGVTFIQGATTAARYFLFTLAGERIVQRLRTNLYGRLLKQEIGFFDRHSTGELMSRLSADTAVIQSAVSVNISMLTRGLAQALGGLVMLFVTSFYLSLFALALIPPIGIGVAIVGKRLRRFSKEAQNRLAVSATNAEEALSGIRTVKTFVRESFEQDRYASALASLLSVTRSKISTVTWFMAIISVLAAFGLSGMLWLGGRFVFDGSLTVGALTSFVLYLLIVSFAIGSLGSLWTDFVSAFAAASRVFELIDRKTVIEEEKGQALKIQSGLVEFRDVSFAYPSRVNEPVTQHVSFRVEPGEAVAFVGPSGAGKSTLLSLLLRFYDLSEGEICIDGQPIRQVLVSDLRSQIAMVSQEVFLLSASIEDNIRYGRLDATDAEVRAAAKASYVDDFVSQFSSGYQTEVGERGVQLSGGQRQRVAIARALLKNPKILILDEATSALDAESEFQIREALKVLMAGRTTFIIAHRLSTVRMANRVLVFERGRLVQAGRHDELVEDKSGVYAKLVDRQVFLDRA